MAGVERVERGNPQEASSRHEQNQMYVHDLPYMGRKQLCRILDVNSDWKELAGTHMKYTLFEIMEIENEWRRCGSSPSDCLLSRWSQQNHTVLELFVLLARMRHHPAMSSLKEYVEPRYHAVINQQAVASTSSVDNRMVSSDNNNSKSNIPIPVQRRQQGIENESSEKILNGPPYQSNTDSSSRSVNSSLAKSVGVLLMIPYAELEVATNNWMSENILGQGGFGTVYKGVWKHTAVAIKKLKRSNSDGSSGVSTDSLRELKYLNACRHDNILPLYGYSIEGNHSCLVYQLMSGGSLEDRLKCKHNQPPLLWDQRLRIAQGVAKGLQFLHTVSQSPLIHGDIKSGNILLDTCGEPKIGDFGLAREGPDNEELTHIQVSSVYGTRPYLPDEFLRDKKLSVKVDTYSFGIVVFELLTGLPAYRERQYLKDIVIEHCKKYKNTHKNILDLHDKRLLDIGKSNPGLFMNLLVVGIKCVQGSDKRPCMVDIWEALMKIKYTEPNPETQEQS